MSAADELPGDDSLGDSLGPAWRGDPVVAGRGWAASLGTGIAAIAVGVALVVWPGRTLAVVATLAGVALAVLGAREVHTSWNLGARWSSVRLWVAIAAVLTGIALVVRPGFSRGLVGVILGVGLVLVGLVLAAAAWTARPQPRWRWSVASGLLAAAGGVVVLAFPRLSLTVLGLTLGGWAIATGGLVVVGAWQARAEERAAAPPAE